MKKATKRTLICMLSLLMLYSAAGCGSAGAARPNGGGSGGGGSASPEQAQDITCRVGDCIETNALRITYLSSGYCESDNPYVQPAEGNQYIYIELFCENIADYDSGITFFNFECTADGESCDPAFGMNEDASSILSPGRTGRSKFFFEVPQNAKDIVIGYELSYFTDKTVPFIFEGDKDSGITPDISATETPDAYTVGTTVQSEELRLTYLSCGELAEEDSYLQPKDGYHFIYCEFEVENRSDEDVTIIGFGFNCYADNIRCSNVSCADELNATLASGESARGKVAFSVPLDAKIIEVEYDDLVSTGEGHEVFAYQP